MKPVYADEAAIGHAADMLRRGRLVAFPTETVYGLGADASNPEAVLRIFEVKGRPADHPLIVHIECAERLTDWAADVPETAVRLARHFWPGPLAIILPKKPSIPSVVTGGQMTVGLRVPGHPIALQLLKKFAGAIAAPSANRFCRISPTQAHHVEQELGDGVDCILDGGPCQVGVESTIVDLSGGYPKLLRPGHITREQIENVLQEPLTLISRTEANEVRAPGMMVVHYAPLTPTSLCSGNRLMDYLEYLSGSKQRVGVLLYSSSLSLPAFAHVRMPLTAVDYAQELYAALRDLDHRRLDHIVIEQPPVDSSWMAVNDRLGKACSSFI